MTVLAFHTGSKAETRAAGRLLAGHVAPGDVITLDGDLGAGKTVLVRGLAEGLDVDRAVTSPTFNILLVHAGRLTLNHFDLYRLDAEEQLEDIDFWGVLESPGVSAIEWGERFSGALPPDRLSVRIELAPDGSRVFELHPHGRRAEEIASAWMAGLEEQS